MPAIDTVATLAAPIVANRFVRIVAADMRVALGGVGSIADWDAFRQSWDALGPDTYMADGGRYRRRRFAVMAALDRGAITREAHQPHYQSRDYNTLNGGVQRWFDAIDPTILAGETCTSVVSLCRDVFSTAAPSPKPWHIELHQFRIEATPGKAGKPTPEGMHRDGVDYVLVMMVGRTNIKSGETIMADADRRETGRFTLTEPFDAVMLDDRHVYHGVTPVEAVDASKPAHRDVLVVTFRRA